MTNKLGLVTMLVVLLVALMQSIEGAPEESALPVHVVKRQATNTPPPQSTWCRQQPLYTVPGPGYEYFSGLGYYKFHTEARTWDQARRTCESEGAYLAIINCDEEDNVLQQLFGRYPTLTGVTHNNFTFIGFHDRFIEGEYLTIQGTSLQSTGFTRWSSANQPDNAGGNENCGSMHRNGGLNDIPCQWNLAYICEHVRLNY